MPARLELIGDEIFLGSYRVAKLEPGLWASLRDDVASAICASDEAALDEALAELEKEHEDEIRYMEQRHDADIEALEDQISALEDELHALKYVEA